MYVIAELSVIPLGAGASVSQHIAACQRILADTKLHYELHANGTNIEGEWSEVATAIERCHTALHESGVPRIITTLKLQTRTDKPASLESMRQSVQSKLSPPR